MKEPHLKDRQYYEDRYDRITVDIGRENTKFYQKMHNEFFKIMPDEPENSHRAVIHLNLIYVLFVGNDLLRRYDDREKEVNSMMAKDEAKDKLLINARLEKEPACQYCRAVGLRITDKILCSRNSFDDPEEVLFFLQCLKCNKRLAVWSDCEVLEPKIKHCSKCNSAMSEQTTRRGKVITTTYTCVSCEHQYKDKLDLTSKPEKRDPNFEADREIYCLHDEKFLQELRDAKWRYEEMTRLGKEWEEREENKHIYDAIAELKKLKIAELMPLLKPKLEEAGYIEFSLGKPEIGKIAFVGFSCLDGKTSRIDRESQKVLQKAVEDALIETNWRLTNEGISYRLGYLTGRIRAYEDEADLKRLVLKNKVLLQKVSNHKANKQNEAKDKIIF